MWKFPSVLWLFLSFILSSAEIVLKYHNYEELTLKLQNLVAKYPDLLSLYNLSDTSIQGMIPAKFCKPTFLHSTVLVPQLAAVSIQKNIFWLSHYHIKFT